MTTQMQLTLDRVLRIVISIGIVLSVLGTPAFVPLAQAKTNVTQPLREPQPEGTPVVEETPTPEPTPSVEPVTPEPVTVEEQSSLTEPAPTESSKRPVYTPPLTVTSQLVDQRGGRFASTDQRIQLEVPAGLFKTSTQIQITPRLVERATDPSGMLLRFDLDAVNTKTQEVQREFEQPITLTVDLRGIATWENTPPGTRLTVMTAAEDGSGWAEVSGAAMPEYGLLIVPIQHFSQWASGYMAQQWKISYNAPVVSTFSGAGAFNYPIEVPPGRNGFAPQVNLSYNSRRVDGLMEPGWNSQPPLGMGWSIDTLDVVREDIHKYGTNNWFGDDFSLAVNGTSYHLVPDVTGQNNGFYRAKDGPWLLARRINDCTDDGDCQNASSSKAPNHSGEYWLVWMGDGTVARLGYPANAEQRQITGQHYCPGYCYWGASYRWRVDIMTDTVGNTMRFTYHEDESTTDQPLIGRSRISKIEYNNSTAPGAAAPQYTSWVEFNAAAELPGYFNANYINQIKVYNAGALVREYRLTLSNEYGDGPADECGQYVAMEEINSIQQFDASGNALPATSFGYIRQNHRGNKDCAHYWYLNSVSNGYGAATTLTYNSDGRWQGCWPQPTYIGGTKTCDDDSTIGLSYRVTQAQTNDGRNNIARTQYAYGAACYNQHGSNTNGGTICRSPGRVESTGPLVGHQTTTETAYDYDNTTILQKIVHTFDVTDYGPYQGRENQTQVYAADGTTKLTQTDNTYDQLTFGNGVTFAYLKQTDNTTYASGTSLTQRTRYEYDTYGNQTRQYQDGNTATTADNRTIQNFYNYATSALSAPGPTWWPRTNATATSAQTSPRNLIDGDEGSLWISQDNPGYETIDVWLDAVHPVNFIKISPHDHGFPTQIMYYYWNGTTWVWYTTQDYRLSPAAPFVVWLPAGVNTNGIRFVVTGWRNNDAIIVREVYAGQAATVSGHWLVNKPARTNLCPESAPIGCGTTAVQRTLNYYDGSLNNDAPPTRGQLTAVAVGSHPQGYVTTTMAYDAWGNPTVVTDVNNNRTVTAYDGSYHRYPIQVMNAKEQTVQIQYNFTLGVPTRVVDIDGQTTSMTYDGFGRALKIIRPGDTEALPTTEYRYDLNGDLHALQVYQHEVSGVGSTDPTQPYVGTQWAVEWVNGLGQTYQSRTEAGDGSIRVQDTFYDAAGRAITQSVPYAVTTNEWLATPADLSKPRTTTTYDTLGRVRQITAPDGTQTTHSYLLDTTSGSGYTPTGLPLHAVVDANQHGKHYVTDAFNQLTVVRELTGTVAPRPLYAETKYTYDLLGNLTQVRDALGNTTVMTYNTWNQKTEMFDPDMGHWTYTYDPAGNLKTQTDAKNQTITFNYDALNRLTSKSTGVTYGYDVDPNKAAHITSVKGMESIGELGVYDGNTTLALTTDHVEGTYAVQATTGTPGGGYGNYGPSTTFSSAYRWWHVRVKPVTPNSWTRFWFWDASDGRWEAMLSLDGDVNFEVGEDLQLNRWNELWLDTAAVTNAGNSVGTPQNGTMHASPNSTFIWDDIYGAMPEVRYHVGQRTSMTDQSGSANWVYDLRGRVTQESKTINGATAAFNTSYTYDAMDRAQTITYPTGEVVTQTYNAASQLTQVRSQTYGLNYASGMTYNPLGQLKQMNLGNGLQLQNTYFGLDTYAQWGNTSYGRLRNSCVLPQSAGTCVENTVPTGGIYNTNYWYDGVGNVTGQVNAPSSEYLHYGYDALDRLTNVWPHTGYAGYTQNFTYNEIGNFTTKAGVTHWYSDTLHKHAVTKAGNDLFTYDANGNMLTRQEGSATYEQVWTSENRIKAVDVAQPPSWQESFTTLNTSAWNFSCQGATPGCQSVDNGTLRSIGNGSDHSSNFYRSAFNLNGGQQGQGVQFEFKVERNDASAHFTLEASGSPYRRFGFIAGMSNKIVVQYTTDGANWTYVDLLNPVETGVWYVGTLKVKPDGAAFMEVWRKDNPGKHGAISIQMPAGLSYRFHHYIRNGSAWTDNYQERNYQSTQYTYDGDGNRVKKVGLSARTWVEDAQPFGSTSTCAETWQWVSSPVQSGSQAHVSTNSAGQHQHCFLNASDTLSVYAGDTLVQWVYIPSGTPPTQIMLQWNDGTSWDHRAYWGTDNLGWGGYYMGPLPTERNQWIKLTVPASVVGLANQTVRGWAYTLFNGSIYWDNSGVERNSTTVYVGGLYEKDLTTTETTTYYFSGAQRVAMRQGSNLYYFVADHLGSTSVTLDTSGNKIDEMKYYPFGETRSGGAPTDRRFTGQRAETGLGSLYDYNARMYSPVLGRFLSADTIVPDPSNPQAWNRYAYTLNNPIRYSDPTGHWIDESGCQTMGCATDESWELNFLKGVVHTTDFSDPTDNPLGQMTLNFFITTLDSYTPEAGPMTMADAAKDAWHASKVFIGSGRSAAEAWQTQRLGSDLFTFGVLLLAGGATDFMQARSNAFVEAYLSSGPSINTQVVVHPETRSPNPVRAKDVTNKWDEFLDSDNPTNIHPRTGAPARDRIVSEDGTRSIRYGPHEMNGQHYHEETWFYDRINGIMHYFNNVRRINP